MKISHNKGFTLIELLVVISIIGFLSSIVLASVSTARMKSRNTNRKQELVQMRSALELYYSQNGSYPSTPFSGYTSYPGGCCSGGTDNGGNWIPGLVPNYISALPQDPPGHIQSSHPACVGFPPAYWYMSDGKNYKIQSWCAPEGTLNPNDKFSDPTYPAISWMICNGETVSCNTW